MHNDYLGSPIARGDYVAYNFQGMVRFGVVRNIRTTKRYNRPGFIFEVAQEIAPRLLTDKLSKVTNKSNLAVVSHQPDLSQYKIAVP